MVSTDGVFNVAYVYVALAMFARRVRRSFGSSTTRARDAPGARCARIPLAAELMGMPVGSLKLLAFAFGAAVAALTGTLFAALNGSVFPQTFSFALLITLYTMVILGGAGSQAGVVLGAILISVMLELPARAERLAGARSTLLVVAGRSSPSSVSPSRWPSSSAGVFGFGFAAHAVAAADRRHAGSTGRSARAEAAWPNGRRTG